MIHTDTKFAYRHKPTGKWCYLSSVTIDDDWGKGYYTEEFLHLIDDFNPDILYKARNIIEEDLIRSTMNGERYAALNFHEFELVEIQVQYKIKGEN